MLAVLIQSLAAGETMRVAKRVRRAMIDYLIAGVCLAIGVGFLIAAGYIFVAERYGALYTALGFGLGFIAIAGIALAVHAIRSRLEAKRRAEEARKAQLTTLAGAAALTVLPALLKGRGGVLQMLAPLLAMAAYTIYRENTAGDGDGTPDA